jgi:hypothetical protein
LDQPEPLPTAITGAQRQRRGQRKRLFDRPTVIICHGLPGNEKHLDLTQTARLAAMTFKYRGSWGSLDNYSFAQNRQHG